MGQQMLLILLGVVFFSHSAVDGKELAYVGERGQQTYFECFDDIITSVQLSCTTGDLIHVNYFSLTTNPSCGNRSSCEAIPKFYISTVCDGKNSCQYEPLERSSRCSHYNEMNLTFECIDALSIHNMCPSQSSTTVHNGTAYFSTPGFTQPPYTYSFKTTCQCTVTGDTIHMELLYLDLDHSSSCYDYLELGDGSLNCRSPSLEFDHIRKTFSSNTSWRFVSDSRRKTLGGWMKLTQNESAIFSVTCAKTYTTTTTTTRRTTPRRTTIKVGSDDDASDTTSNLGAIIGGIVGGIFGVILLIALICIIGAVCSVERDAASQQDENHEAVSLPAQTTTVHNNPAVAVGSDDLPPTFDTEGKDLPPAYSSLPSDN